MNAAEIVEKIGAGALEALDTCQLFLGVEESATRNADIHPEYVTTVMIGRKLTGVDRWVSLEASMKLLRRHAAGIARMKTHRSSATSWPMIQQALAQKKYDFGKKRLDILVREASSDRPPLLLVEAKLGVQNLAGVVEDINRIITLFDMYEDVDAIGGHAMYGAVVFHAMQEKGTAATLPAFAASMLGQIQTHLKVLEPTKPNLKFNAGLLTKTLQIADVSGYEEPHDDGTIERVFEKHGYAFQAGLVLIGTALDITTVTF